MAKTIFKEIIDGELPAYTVWEDDAHIAFLDIFPMHEGQVIVIPKKEVEYIFDMSDEEYTALLRHAKRIAQHMKQVFGSERIGLVVEGLEVPHVHVKLIPIGKDRNIDPKHIKKAHEADLKKLQARLKEAMKS